MQARVIVAHPDDCLIFAYSFIRKYPQHDWSIAYLTYSAQDQRAEEFARFWNKRGVATEFLGFVDDWHDIENKQISFDTSAAEQAIAQAVQGQDFILTHNDQGDYGHLHHVFVHQAVVKHHPHVITFQGHEKGNEKIIVDQVDYTIEEFPSHADIVMQFHIGQHKNEYHVPDAMRSLIERK